MLSADFGWGVDCAVWFLCGVVMWFLWVVGVLVGVWWRFACFCSLLLVWGGLNLVLGVGCGFGVDGASLLFLGRVG